MFRLTMVLLALISTLLTANTQAVAADRDQIRGERCLLTAGYLSNNLNSEFDTETSYEIDKNIRCATRLLETKARVEARKNNSKNNNKNKAGKNKGGNNKAGKNKGGNGKGGKGKGGKNKGDKGKNGKGKDNNGKDGKGTSKDNKDNKNDDAECLKKLKENQAQRAVVVKKRDDCLADAETISDIGIKEQIKGNCHQDFYTEINKIPFIFCNDSFK